MVAVVLVAGGALLGVGDGGHPAQAVIGIADHAAFRIGGGGNLVQGIVGTVTPGKAVSSTEYDRLGRTTKATDARGFATQYVYDKLGPSY